MRRIAVVAIASNLLLVLITLYFKYFPHLISPRADDVILVSAVLILIVLLVYGVLLVKSARDVWILLPSFLALAFLARLVAILRTGAPFNPHDPYYYFISALNVVDYGTLTPTPEIASWYSGAGQQLHWPVLHLLTAALTDITGLNPQMFFLYLPPAMGPIFFLTVFMLAKTVTGNDKIALLAGMLASLNDIIGYFQSEYHPQGLAMLLLVLTFYLFIKSRESPLLAYRVLALLSVIALIQAHHFTALFVALIFGMYWAVTQVFALLRPYVPKGWLREIAMHLSPDPTLLIIVFVMGLGYHFLIYPEVVTSILEALIKVPAIHASLASVGKAGVPLLGSLLNAVKWVAILLAMIALIRMLKTRRPNEFRLAALLGCLVVAGVIGNYAFFSPMERVVGFAMSAATIFAAITLYRWLSGGWATGLLAVILAVVVAAAGFFNTAIPAYYFKTAQPDAWYWYSNVVPVTAEYRSAAGEWLASYTPMDSEYDVDWDVLDAAFLYAQRSLSRIDLWATRLNPKGSERFYAVLSPRVPRRGEITRDVYQEGLNAIYGNGEIEVYGLPAPKQTGR